MKKTLPTLPPDLIAANPAGLQAKLANFARLGSDGLHVVLDFDRTLTVRGPGATDDVTTWHILQQHLPEDGKRRYQELFEKYRTLELAGTMTPDDAVTWWSSILDIFVEHRIDLGAVEEDFLSKATMRPGTKELFELCASHGIPMVILSAGMRDVIEIWCRKYGISPALVLSTALVVDGQSRIVGWEKDTLVHVRNKSEADHAELLSIRGARPNALVIGDSLDDAAMVGGNRHVMRVRILDPREDEMQNAQEQQRTFEKFDALIAIGTLGPLGQLIETIARG